MTAQVAVLNLAGVAVASDTFVTTWIGNQAKSMGNTHKIYELGTQHKVVVLHSGAASINSVPQQLHIAEWAKTLSLPLPTLQAYADSYRTWSASEKKMSTPEAEWQVINAILNEHYHDLAREIDAALDGLYFEDGTTERKKRTAQKQLIHTTIDGNGSYLHGLETYPGLTERLTTKWITDHEFNVGEKVEYIFKRFELEEAWISRLVDLAPFILARIQPMASDSEIAFVGFGEDEPFAGTLRMTCRGLYGGVLAATTGIRFRVAPIDNPSGISYFAQRDAMWGFVNGSTPGTLDEMRNQINEAVEKRWGHTTPELIGVEVADEVAEKINEWAQETYVSPMLKTIEAMGMNSLASLADSLVGLQATATYSQAGAATVGGLIEVATIDRINGVQWKRSLPRNHDAKID